MFLVPKLHLETTIGAKPSLAVKPVPKPSLGTELTGNPKKF